jgi:hypothetical protein
MKLKKFEERTVQLVHRFSPELAEKFAALEGDANIALLDDLAEAAVFDALFIYKKAEAGMADMSAVTGNDLYRTDPIMVRLQALGHLVGWTLMDLLNGCGESDAVSDIAIQKAAEFYPGFLDKVLASVQKAKVRNAAKEG